MSGAKIKKKSKRKVYKNTEIVLRKKKQSQRKDSKGNKKDNLSLERTENEYDKCFKSKTFFDAVKVVKSDKGKLKKLISAYLDGDSTVSIIFLGFAKIYNKGASYKNIKSMSGILAFEDSKDFVIRLSEIYTKPDEIADLINKFTFFSFRDLFYLLGVKNTLVTSLCTNSRTIYFGTLCSMGFIKIPTKDEVKFFINDRCKKYSPLAISEFLKDGKSIWKFSFERFD